jgi:hypothetical protein
LLDNPISEAGHQSCGEHAANSQCILDDQPYAYRYEDDPQEHPDPSSHHSVKRSAGLGSITLIVVNAHTSAPLVDNIGGHAKRSYRLDVALSPKYYLPSCA